jgi:hypothetical protein
LIDFKGVLVIIDGMFQLIFLERIGSLGELRRRKEEKHCKVSWFYGM